MLSAPVSQNSSTYEYAYNYVSSNDIEITGYIRTAKERMSN